MSDNNALQEMEREKDEKCTSDDDKIQSENYKSSNHKDDDYSQMARTYYKTWAEANSKRRKGDRIYYTPGRGLGYYIVRPKKRDIWDIF